MNGGTTYIMNQETRYALAFYEVCIVIRDTLEYAVPKAEFSVEAYTSRKNMITHLLDEHSPISFFCANNGETGAKIKTQITEFFDDVYGDESRIVKIDHGKVTVEQSLVIQLLDYVIGLHETFNDICHGFKGQFEKDGKLEENFSHLLEVDDRFYRALAVRTILLNTNAKFTEFNASVKSYVENTIKTTGVDPRQKPDFNPADDPSVKFITNEMSKLIGFFRFVKAHNRSGEFDPLFTSLLEECENKIHLYDGTRKLLPGQDMPTALKELEDTVVPYIEDYRVSWLNVFNPIFQDLKSYEENLMAARQAEAAKTDGEEK